MVTTSKRWAILSGLMIVAAGILTETFWSGSKQDASIVSALFASAPPSAPVVAAGANPGADASPGKVGLGEVDPGKSEAAGTKQDAVPPKSETAAHTHAGGAAADPRSFPAPGAASPEPPRFDVVRVEPDGGVVLAGQAAPNATVELLVSGKAVADATCDETGHFAMVPPPLAPGGYALSLRQTHDGIVVDSAQIVAVSVPEKNKGDVIVALDEPGKAVKLLAVPKPAMDTAPLARAQPAAGGAQVASVASLAPASSVGGGAAGLAIRSVELENSNGFYASGVAAPGTKLHLYLNNSHLTDVVASAASAWSVKIKQGLTGGHYIVRADAAADGAHVASRVEVPFDIPAGSLPSAPVQARTASPQTVAAAPLQATTAASAAGGSAADAVITDIKTAVVRSGDNLWDISRVQLGEGARYTRIYAANATQIRNPDLIYPGQVFVLPSRTD